MELAALNTTNAINQDLVNLRKRYVSLIQTWEDLYLHMSDVDYLDRFSTPARGKFYLLMAKQDIYDNAVATSTAGISQITIPRDTMFAIEGMSFLMQYPINISIMPHGGLQIVYDVSKTSPIQTLASNIVDWSLIKYNGTDYIRLAIPVYQLAVDRSYNKISDASSFKTSVTFADQYFYTRAYMSVNGIWEELVTTHTDQVYDPYTLTVCLQVVGQVLNVSIPPIYQMKGMLTGDIRLDVFSTKGLQQINLEAYEQVQISFIDGDNSTTTATYAAPLSKITQMFATGVGSTIGGSNGLTFDQMLSRVKTNSAGARVLPITGAQIEAALEELGYGFVKDIDNLTVRSYLATRALPNPYLPNNALGAGCAINTLTARADDLVKLDTVEDNNIRLTLLPKTLYKLTNGNISIVSRSQITAWTAMTPDAFITDFNNGDYLYSPFHYVFDMDNNSFGIRPYYLEQPVINNKIFDAENPSAGMQVSTGTWAVFKEDYGYRIVVTTLSSSDFKALPDENIALQLSFIANNESTPAYLNGTLLGVDPNTTERIYEFRLECTHDIDPQDQIYVNNFKMFDSTTVRYLPTSLVTNFSLNIILLNYTNSLITTSSIDNLVGAFLLPDTRTNFVSLVRETFVTELGYSLTGLWNKSRTIADAIEYQTYSADVPLTYTQDIYQLNTDGSYALDTTGATPKLIKLHSAGDPVLDANSVPVYLHRVGDVRLDSNGQPIPKDVRHLLRQVDLFLIDGRYFFATEANTVSYAESIPTLVIDWLVNDIAPIASDLIQNSEISFYPLTTIGQITVIADEGNVITINSEQSLSVIVYVDAATYNNQPLQDQMSLTIANTIANAIQQTNFSTSGIISTLTATLGSGVFGIDVSGIAGTLNVNSITMTDSSVKCVLKKKLALNSDRLIVVEDDINISYKLHTTS